MLSKRKKKKKKKKKKKPQNKLHLVSVFVVNGIVSQSNGLNVFFDHFASRVSNVSM